MTAPAKRCTQCAAEMDVGETVCPQCGFGIKEQSERQAKAKAESRPPTIEMSDLSAAWPTMRPAQRRRAMRARVRGTDRTLVARVKKLFGIGTRPTPPPPRRVAARALALAHLVWRARIEMNLQDHPPDSWEPQREHLSARLKSLGIAGELEPPERDFFRAAFGRVDPMAVTSAAWRGEGLAVLAWALGRLGLPAYDEEAFPPDHAQESVGFDNLEVARELLDSGSLRHAEEIERYAVHATIVTWRLRTFRMYPGPWDFVGHLRRQPAFRETWMDGLRIVDADLAIGEQAIANAPTERVQTCERIAVERQIAAYWLEGDDAVYSKVDPTTLLSTC